MYTLKSMLVIKA